MSKGASAKRRSRSKLTTRQKGLDWRQHRYAADTLKRHHKDGTLCDWCGRPMYRDPTRNWDYNPQATHLPNGSLAADHSKLSRSEAIRRGLPIPKPDRLLHGTCNTQRGEGGNDHLAASTRTPNLGTLTMAERLGQVGQKLADWEGEAGTAFHSSLGRARTVIEADGRESRQVASTVSDAKRGSHHPAARE